MGPALPVTQSAAALADEIPALRRTIAASDRLIASAISAVSSFYIEQEGDVATKRFLRDSNDDPQAEKRFSTGGAAVAADLWEIRHHARFLDAVDGDRFSDLEAKRDGASSWLADPAVEFGSSGTYGLANAFTISSAAQQIVRAEPESERAKAFGARVLGSYGEGWPRLEGVGHRHPFIAHRVFLAAEAVVESQLEYPTPGEEAKAVVVAANLGKHASPPDGEEADPFTRALNRIEEFDVDSARQEYVEHARDYLWQQHGFSVPGSLSAPNFLKYDPVGACLALDVLISASERLGDGSDPMRHVAEYEDLIQLSVRHVLEGMNPTGSLVYGRPFSYSKEGMGAFATSVSGLAALARVLASIFEGSRRSFYTNERFIHELLDSNAELFERFFALPTTIEASKRRVGHFSGWSNDRAASFSRLESWVSMDVLLLAVHLRILAQEVAQFRVVNKHGAHAIVAEPEWPYQADSGEPIPVSAESAAAMQDPDEHEAGQEPDWAHLAPTRVLHREFQPFMDPNTERWEHDKATFLLFGPPGTAKSTLVKSLAQRLGWHFLELTPSDFIDRGLEGIEQRSREIFGELAVLRETVVLFDELDSLLTDREQLEASSILNFTVPAMLPKVQALTRTAKRQRLLVIFATNFFDRLDPAMARRGRIDERLVVLPHNANARRRMLQRKLSEETLEKAVDDTPLAVYEDLRRYQEAVKEGREPSLPVSGVTAGLYHSRIPREDQQESLVRSTQRLGIEVAEVVARLVGEPRSLSADARRREIERRLEELREKLSTPEHDEWRALCQRLMNALHSTQ